MTRLSIESSTWLVLAEVILHPTLVRLPQGPLKTPIPGFRSVPRPFTAPVTLMYNAGVWGVNVNQTSFWSWRKQSSSGGGPAYGLAFTLVYAAGALHHVSELARWMAVLQSSFTGCAWRLMLKRANKITDVIIPCKFYTNLFIIWMQVNQDWEIRFRMAAFLVRALTASSSLWIDFFRFWISPLLCDYWSSVSLSKEWITVWAF